MLIAKYAVFFIFFGLKSFAADFINIEDNQPIKVPEEIQVKVSDTVYLISNIYVSGNAESESQAFDNGLYNAKFIAFKVLKNNIQDSFLAEDNETIDAAMTGFVPNGGIFEDGNYQAKFDILFDKEKIATLISENKIVGIQRTQSGKESIVARIAIKNDIANWVKVRSRLEQNNINYSLVSLNLSEVEILFKNINILKLTDALNGAKLEIVANRDFYFIKVPLFS